MPEERVEITYAAALRSAMREEMRRDVRVIMLGEDIGVYGGVFKVTADLAKEFGTERIRDTPISENAIVGAAVGAAIDGLVPIVEIQYAGFSTLVMDALVTHAAFLRYMSGGRLKIPMVVRMPICQNRGAGAQHSLTTPIAWFSHVPGLKVVAPSTPYDVKGMLKSGVRDSNPVVFLEHVELYRRWNKGFVPEGDYLVPIGRGEVKTVGEDVTIVAYSLGVHRSIEAAAQLKQKGIDAEVLDLRTLSPLDRDLVLNSVRKTGRAVVVDLDFRTGGIGGEIASIICEEALYSLKAPVRRVASKDVPVPFAPSLEGLAHPRTEDIVGAALTAMEKT